MKKFIFILSITLVLGLTTLGNATLWNRGGGLIYDDDLNITWLQDANYAMTSGYPIEHRPYANGPAGSMTWYEAMTWANNLVYGGYDDWRLPTTSPATGFVISEPGFFTGESEMGHLYSTELGREFHVSMPNVDGPFINLMPNQYWTGTEWSSYPTNAWHFSFSYGDQGLDDKDGRLYAWAVRDGDIGSPVPVPAAVWLFGSGLVGLIGIRRRFKK